MKCSVPFGEAGILSFVEAVLHKTICKNVMKVYDDFVMTIPYQHTLVFVYMSYFNTCIR